MENDINEYMWKKIQQDNDMRLTIAMNLMQAGNGHGYYLMAQRYKFGWKVAKDAEKALTFYKEAANKHHAGACVELAKFYLLGCEEMSIEKNLEIAANFGNQGIQADPDAYKDIENYDQKSNISEASLLIRAIKHEETKSSENTSRKHNYK